MFREVGISKPKPNFFAVPPKFLQEPQDVVAVEGQDILVPCVVEGFPDPVIKWRREETDGDAGSAPGDTYLAGMAVNQQFPNGSLLLTLATESMEGRYTCTATNGVKYDISKTINITVNGEEGGYSIFELSTVFNMPACFKNLSKWVTILVID